MRNLRNYVPLLLLTTTMPILAGERIDESMSLGNAKSVTIENLRGEVSVTGNDGDTVSVTGELDDKAKRLNIRKIRLSYHY